jgi:hypothetical protein
MEKRLRSPSYPSLSLKDAVERVRKLATEIGQRSVDRGTVAVGMGYSGLSGSSASAISALQRYGLIEGRGDSIAVTDRAMTILYPNSPSEMGAALREAALGPELFKDLFERFGDSVQNDEIIRNFLLRNKFAPNAVAGAISAYRETIEFVGGLGPVHDSPQQSIVEQKMDIAPVEISARAPSPAIVQHASSLEGFEEDKTNLDEGPASLILPKNLSPESVDELDYWIQGVLRRMKRRARAALESRSDVGVPNSVE